MLGVIPAGGRATRFTGIYKDLLPIGDGVFLLSEAIRRAIQLGADQIAVVTSAEKATVHERFLREHPPSAPTTLLVSSDQGLWGAIRATFCFERASILVLPDTVFDVVAQPPRRDLALGVFVTDTPERFSLLVGDTIVTKPADYPAPQSAWGCVAWSQETIAFWQEQERTGVYPHYDDAFRDAMAHVEWYIFPIEEYHDLGTWEAYRAFIERDDPRIALV